MKHNPCIKVDNVSFHYGATPVLEDVSFQVKRGEYLGIIGPNGGGKTTLLKLMLNLLQPSKGTISIHGQAVARLKDRTDLGYVPQRSSQNLANFPATVEEIITSGRTAKVGLLKRLSAQDHHKVEWAMEVAEVLPLRKKLITELSGGQRQRVFIARALASEPEILFLDEPTVAVDAASSQKFYSFLNQLNTELGITIIFVSHDIDFVAREVNSLLCLNRRLVCHGPPSILLQPDVLQKLYGKNIKFVDHKH